MKKFGWISLLILVALLIEPAALAVAQGTQPSGPVYVVQSGDTLWDIAQRFSVSMAELASANGIGDLNSFVLNVGTELVIPGLEGIEGRLTTQDVAYGETLTSLSRRDQIPVDILVRLNHVTSPIELYAGASLVIPERDEDSTAERQRVTLRTGQSLLELAVAAGSDPWRIAEENGLAGTWASLPGDVLFVQGAASDGPSALPEQIRAVEVSPLPLVQGKTTVVRVKSDSLEAITGQLVDRELHFFSDEAGEYVALQGIYAMLPSGMYPLSVQGTLSDGTPFGFSQLVGVASGGYPYETLIVNEATLDPTVNEPENAQWTALAQPVTGERMWDDIFIFPMDRTWYDCWPSTFGRRRSYNGSEFNYFHTGLDVCGSNGLPIYAPAAGEVVFADFMTVRGHATLINHGWGVYTAYMHQSEILVNVGDTVAPGQLIGRVGETGRVTGPHLHWEVWAGGLQVDPFDWLQRAYP